jgi:hypothetical protein
VRMLAVWALKSRAGNNITGSDLGVRMDDIQTGGAWAIISRMFRYDQGQDVRASRWTELKFNLFPSASNLLRNDPRAHSGTTVLHWCTAELI